MDRPAPPPEAVMLRLAREASGTTVSEAAAAAGISAARWSQVELGYGNRRGPLKPVRARSGTLARMAHAVGVGPGRLEEGDRPDAAEILREIRRREGDGGGQGEEDLPSPAASVPAAASPAAAETAARAAGVTALLTPDEAAIWREVRTHHGPGPVFSDPDEMDLWSLTAFSEGERVRMIAAVRLARAEHTARMTGPLPGRRMTDPLQGQPRAL